MKNFSKDLLVWYNVNKRHFPWRDNINVYHTWICEIMSQQTVISVVLPRFKEFINEIPNLNSLASCSDDKLRKLWAGLGYYARARNLRKGAQYILNEFDGVFPNNNNDWLKVPGCGPYTAAVIASICFNEPIACVDGNVIRVVSRLLNLQSGVWEKDGLNKINSYVNEWIAKDHPGDFNQAMMDLGATVCKKQNPSCYICPVKIYCQAYASDSISLCPPVKPRKDTKLENVFALVFEQASSQNILLVKRNHGFLNKTIGFPLIKENQAEFISTFLQELKKIGLNSSILKGEFKHSITHHKILAKVIIIKNVKCEVNIHMLAKKYFFGDEWHWLPISQLKHNLSSSLDLKVLKLLSSL